MSTPWRLATAMLLSLAVHALLLAGAGSGPQSRPEPSQAGRLTVALQKSEGAAAPEAPAPGHRESPAAPSRESPRPQTEASEPVFSGTEAAEPDTPADAPVEPATTESRPPDNAAAEREEPGQAAAEKTAHPERVAKGGEVHDSAAAEPTRPAPGARAAVRTRLENELARHFHYPMLARRRGWEGKVVLRLRFDTRGAIDAMEIAESSGHGILDQAALDAVARVSRIPEAERAGGAGLHLEVPVIYQLREG